MQDIIKEEKINLLIIHKFEKKKRKQKMSNIIILFVTFLALSSSSRAAGNGRVKLWSVLYDKIYLKLMQNLRMTLI